MLKGIDIYKLFIKYPADAGYFIRVYTTIYYLHVHYISHFNALPVLSTAF